MLRLTLALILIALFIIAIAWAVSRRVAKSLDQSSDDLAWGEWRELPADFLANKSPSANLKAAGGQGTGQRGSVRGIRNNGVQELTTSNSLINEPANRAGRTSK